MTPPYIEWQNEKGDVERRILHDKIFLGRFCRGVGEDKCIRINHPTVSRDHAVIQTSSLGIELTDASINGTWINGVRMAPGSTRFLNDGDTIELGTVTLTLFNETARPSTSENDWEEKTIVRPAAVWVTSLVADVRGFSAMCQSFDSDVAYGLMKEVFTRFTDVITAHRGTVKDYAGDAVFAFWEHAHGDASEQALMACRAALAQQTQVGEIRNMMDQRHTEYGSLCLGWGITTGPAVLSSYGSQPAALALVGDCINLAFRFSATANKEVDSDILIDRYTASLVETEMPLHDLGHIPTKGREGLEQIYGITR